MATKHCAIILFRVLNKPRVLFGIKKCIRSHLAVFVEIASSGALQICELTYNFRFAGLRKVERRGIAVGLGIISKSFKTGIAVSCTRGGLGIYLFQIINDVTD